MPTARTSEQRRRDAAFWGTVVIVGGAILFGFNAAQSAQVVESAELSAKWAECDSDCTHVRLQILSVDVTQQIASARAYITPPEMYADNNSNSSILNVPMYVDLDVSTIASAEGLSAQLEWNEGDSVPAIDFELDLSNEAWASRSADQFFPLDRYSMESNGLVAYKIGGASTPDEADDEWAYPPVRVISYSNPLPDLSLEYTYEYRDPALSSPELAELNATFIKDLERGQFATSILVTRPPLTIMIVSLLCLIFISGGISMLFLYRAILFGSRPATLAGLVWSASTAFTLIQTRGLLPSNPRSGILLDIWVFYPSLVLCFLFAVLMFIRWLRTDDWAIDEAAPEDTPTKG